MFLSYLLQNLVESDTNRYIVLNKFATMYCKRFLPHLKNVSTLPRKTVVFFVLKFSYWKTAAVFQFSTQL